MNSVDLHAVVLTEQAPSAIAIILRKGGYMVTRTPDEERAIWWLEERTAAALVIDLPLFAASRILRRLALHSRNLPLRALTLTAHDPGRILPAGSLTLNRGDIRVELTRLIDRICIDAARRDRNLPEMSLSQANG